MGNKTTTEYHEETIDYYIKAFQAVSSYERSALQLILRLINTSLLIVLLVTHVKSVRAFRWEQSVSGGVFVTYLLASFGLTLCAVTDRCEHNALQVYLCSTGVTFLSANAVAILSRWHFASELTQALAEILSALGVPLRRQILMKLSLSVATAMCFLADIVMELVLANYDDQLNSV